MIRRRLSGLVAAPFTAMNEDRSINLDAIEGQARSLVDNGVKGVFICGTTGEGMSLTVHERMEIAKRWREVVSGELTLIVHVGHVCQSDSKALAAHAQRIGADAIAAIAPFFFKPACTEDLVSFCAEIAAAAPEMPFYYYHIPGMTGVNLLMRDFLRIGADRIPTLAGIKFSCDDLVDFGLCVSLNDGRFNMLFGRDEALLAGLALGADGAVGSTYNYAAPLYHRIIDAYKAGDMNTARKEQARSQAMATVLYKYGALPAGKAIMRMIGLDCGVVRPPLRDLSEEQYGELAKALNKIGFFDYCSKI